MCVRNTGSECVIVFCYDRRSLRKEKKKSGQPCDNKKKCEACVAIFSQIIASEANK